LLNYLKADRSSEGVVVLFAGEVGTLTTTVDGGEIQMMTMTTKGMVMMGR